MNHPTIISDTELEPELAEAVRDLWTDERIPSILERSTDLSSVENAA